MLETLNNLDTRVFLWINHHHCVVADWVLWVSSQAWSWAVVLLAFFCLVTLRREPRNWWLVVLGIALCFLFSDRVSVLCFKEVVCRLRPCHVLDDVRMFRSHCGGQYGFVSSHAANVFALAMFLSLRYGGRKKQVDGVVAESNMAKQRVWIVPALAFLWAFVVIYSRPYLGKHYPGDCICGAIVGVALGSLVFFLLERISFTRSSRPKKQKDEKPEEKTA